MHHCIPASQSPLTTSCSGLWFKTNCVCRALNGGSALATTTGLSATQERRHTSLLATQECRDTNWVTRTTVRVESGHCTGWGIIDFYISWCPSSSIWARRPRGSVGIAALLCRWRAAGGGSIPRWSGSDKTKIFIHQSWIWALHAIGTFGFHRVHFIAGDSALHGFSSDFIVNLRFGFVGECFKMLELCFGWTRRFRERTWGLRKFCQPEEHCTEHL